MSIDNIIEKSWYVATQWSYYERVKKQYHEA
jgi:hypothetical protein